MPASIPKILHLPMPEDGPWLDFRRHLYGWIQTTRDMATAADVLHISYRGLQDFVHTPEMARVRSSTVTKLQSRAETLFDPELLAAWLAGRKEKKARTVVMSKEAEWWVRAFMAESRGRWHPEHGRAFDALAGLLQIAPDKTEGGTDD